MICETSHAIISEWAHRERLAKSYEYYIAEELERMEQANRPAQEQRVVEQRPALEPYRPYRAYNTYDNRGSGDSAGIVKIVLIIIKILFIVAKCSN